MRQHAKTHWHAPWWAWLLTLTVCASFVGLGNWQLQRAQEKRGIIKAYAQAAQQPVRPLRADDMASLKPLRVRITGQVLSGQQLLLDSQTRNGKPGYDVWTPVRVSGLPGLVLVNRGWVLAGHQRGRLPNVALASGSEHQVAHWQGLWRQLPRPGLRMGTNTCKVAAWPHVVQYPTHEELQCILAAPVMNGVLLLDPQAPNGYVRDWRTIAVSMPPLRHIAYAVQWFALALAVIVVFLVVNRKKPL